MFRWAVSMVVAAWPEGGRWTGILCQYFDNGEIKDAPSGLDLVERWSRAGREGHLSLGKHEGPATVHGRLGLVGGLQERDFVVVVTWTPWQARDEFFSLAEPRPRAWAEAEVERFLNDPYGFTPDDAHVSSASGLFNKLHHYVGDRRHVTDHASLEAGWLALGESG